jgi:hypothetical protein
MLWLRFRRASLCDEIDLRIAREKFNSAHQRAEVHEVIGEAAGHAFADHAHRVMRVQ